MSKRPASVPGTSPSKVTVCTSILGILSILQQYLMVSASIPAHSLLALGSRNEYGQSSEMPTTMTPFFWILTSESSSPLIFGSTKSAKLVSIAGASLAAMARLGAAVDSNGPAPATTPGLCKPRRPTADTPSDGE